MERRIFLLLSLLFLTMGIYAQEADEIHLKEGCLSFFQQEALAFVQVDLSGTEYGKENLYEEYRQTDVEELSKKLLDRSLSDFCVQFNFQNKGHLQVSSKKTDADLRLEIHLRQLNTGSAGGVLNIDDKTACGAKISGFVNLIEVSTGKPLCVIEFCDVTSESRLSKKARIAGAFEELGFLLGRVVRQ